MAAIWRLTLGGSLATAAFGAQNFDVALHEDDECHDETCSLAALQLRAQRRAGEEAAEAFNFSAAYNAQFPGSCRYTYKCGGGFVDGQNCQCNHGCMGHGNCCWDYLGWCKYGAGQEEAKKADCYRTANTYSLNWEAQGNSFFDQFTFVTEDFVHGAHQFTTKSEAAQQRVTTTDDGRAQLRFGGLRNPSFDGEAYKRYSVNLHTNQAWSPKPGFLAVMKYKRLPFGCGVWPSFWAVNSDKVWPEGGELDILEYANYEENKVTFHIASQCQLEQDRVEHCAPQGHTQQSSGLCETNYFKNKLGCMPKQRQPDGKYLAEHPGVIAAEWADDHITIFHIPEEELPKDLESNRPTPGEWGRWVIAFLPFKTGTHCSELGPQELVLNMQLCGDWAGATWQKGFCQAQTGQWVPGCEAGLSSPQDCCTRWVTNEKATSAMQEAYMDIEYLKVFTPPGEVSKMSGTFTRGGKQLS